MPPIPRLVGQAVGLLLLAPAPSQACEWHGSGGFGRYAIYHPLMSKHTPAPLAKALTIVHARTASVTAGAPAVLSVSYRVPDDFQQVSVQFRGSNNLQLQQQAPVLLTKASGTFRLRYRAGQPGIHQITLEINALSNSKPVTLLQHVRVEAG